MNPDLRARIARRLAELHSAAGTTREPFYEDDADAVIEILLAQLDEMNLHDDTGDPQDVGYMAAVGELREALRRG